MAEKKKRRPRGEGSASRKRLSIRLDIPPVTHQALMRFCERHACSTQAAIRKILFDHLNVDGGSTGNG